MKKLILLIVVLMCFNTFGYCQAYRVVIDKKCAAQATANGVAASAHEELIRNEFKNMKEEQNSVRDMVIIVERHLNKVEKVQKDISAFRKEGAAIKLFALKTKKAMKALGDLSIELKKHPLGTVASFKTISSLSGDIYGICRDMIATVVDGKFTLPGIESIPVTSVTDNSISSRYVTPQINLLEPQERLAFYERCCYEMDIVLFKINQMQISIICNDNIDAALLQISPMTYVNREYGKQIANDIINLWKD